MVRHVVRIVNTGIHTYIISLVSALNPLLLMNAFRPIGETFSGVHGKKYLVVSNGDNKAMPRPPSVIASRMPWLAEMMKKNMTNVHHGFENNFVLRKRHKTTTRLSTRAKKIEWEKPLCPRKCSYGMPNENAITSASGRTEQIIDAR